MKNYLDYVERIAETFAEGSQIAPGDQPGVFEMLKCPQTQKTSPLNVLVFAPHPDDECIIGLLPLRLMAECGAKITDVAVTLGSNKARQQERKAELQSACKYLNWDLKICGFENVRLPNRENAGSRWNEYVEELSRLIKRENPDAIFAPNFNDWNATHIGTARLVADAVERARYGGVVFQTEYWGGLKEGNLMVEASPRYIAAQMKALSLHTKEVERNDYHLRLPAWMSDSVRRGAELVGGQGAAAPRFDFATLYNAVRFREGKWEQIYTSKFLKITDRADEALHA